MNSPKVIAALFLITAAASAPLARAANEPAAPQPIPSSQIKPAIGVTGYVLQSEYQFGTAAGNNIRSIADL